MTVHLSIVGYPRLALVTLIACHIANAQSSITGAVTDPSNTPVPAAVVTLARRSSLQSTQTDERGRFVFADLANGTYRIRIVLSGFEPAERTVRAGARGTQSVEIQLKLAALRQELTVDESTPRLSLDGAGNADTISVERPMLDNLPVMDLDYLAALSRFLNPGTAGDAGATLIVDGMEARNVGVTASAIQEIRINNNPYTAEFPRWSRRRIEVITKSSADAFHGTFNFLFRDRALNARDAFALERPAEQRRIFEGSLFGPAGKSKKASFLLSALREEDDLVSVIFAQSPAGAVRFNAPSPQVNTYASGRLTWQPSDRQAMFVQQNFQDRWQNNQGIGGTTLESAGTQNRMREDEFIFNHRVLVTPHLLSQFRILIGRYWAPIHSNSDAPRITVSDAFTAGGSQNDRITTEAHTAITWLMTQTSGRHTLKYGINIPDWSRRGLIDRTNQLGTYSYASLADLEAQRPYSVVVQRGNPKLVFVEANVGGFLQDDWQIRKNLSISFGVRYDWQTYFHDVNNLTPRLALAWAPGKSRSAVIRAGTGYFSERSGPGPVWDILRYDGLHLLRYVNGTPSVHRLARDIALPTVFQFSGGIERQVAKKTTLAVNYVGARGVRQLRSRDGNAPLPPSFAARPDGALSVLRWIESAGRMDSNSLEVTLRGNVTSKATLTAQYVLGKTLTDTQGLNWYPADSFAPSGEWGRADTDRRHQFNLLGTAALHRWANFGYSVALLSPLPFNITTGRDGNGDGMANDRPAGVGRNTGIGPGSAVVDLRWYRDFRLRAARKDKGPSMTLAADAFNLLNRVNYPGFIGARSSPFFGRATASSPARRIQIGLRFQF